jgi:hypothetical protein
MVEMNACEIINACEKKNNNNSNNKNEYTVANDSK